MIEGVIIRACLESDVDSVVRLWRESDDSGGSTSDRESVMRRLAFDDGLFLVAERQGEVIGTVIGGWDGWRGNVYRLVVAAAERRKGVGRRLLHTVLGLMKESGATRVYALAQSEESSAGAIRFWDSSGFARATTVVPYVRWM